MADWNAALTDWLKPFVEKLGHKKRRQMCPLYVAGLIGPGDRKSIEPIAARMAPDRYDRLHHFISDGVWDGAPLEVELAEQADKLIGASDAFLVVDDTSLPKKGEHSVGVAPQYASMLGKRANCQTLVSLTLARHDVPIAVGLRLFLPESWTSYPLRMTRAGIQLSDAPSSTRSRQSKSTNDVRTAEYASEYNRNNSAKVVLGRARRIAIVAMNLARRDRGSFCNAGRFLSFLDLPFTAMSRKKSWPYILDGSSSGMSGYPCC